MATHQDSAAGIAEKPGKAAKARALGINHVVLEVGDLDEALAFYGRLFDFTLRGRNPHNAFIDMGDQFIQLRLGKTQEADGARHFGFVVDNREPVRAALKEMGVELLERGLNFRDPWGNPYVITLDMNDDDKTLDGFYGILRKGTAPQPEVETSVMIWSFGPDGQIDINAGPKAGANRDNILSWE